MLRLLEFHQPNYKDNISLISLDIFGRPGSEKVTLLTILYWYINIIILIYIINVYIYTN